MRFYRLVLALLFLSATGSLAVRLIGNAQPLPPFAAWVTDRDGSPCKPLCLLGVHSGDTKADDVPTILSSHWLAHNFSAIPGRANAFFIKSLQGQMSFSFGTGRD